MTKEELKSFLLLNPVAKQVADTLIARERSRPTTDMRAISRELREKDRNIHFHDIKSAFDALARAGLGKFNTQHAFKWATEDFRSTLKSVLALSSTPMATRTAREVQAGGIIIRKGDIEIEVRDGDPDYVKSLVSKLTQ